MAMSVCYTCTYITIVSSKNTLTSDQHDANCENFLSISIRRHITKSHTCQWGECKIQSSDVSTANTGTTFRFILILIILMGVIGEDLQPSHFAQIVLFRIAYGIPEADKEFLNIEWWGGGGRVVGGGVGDRSNLPNAGQPVGDKCKSGHQEEQHSGSIFWIAINFSCHPHQSE